MQRKYNIYQTISYDRRKRSCGSRGIRGRRSVCLLHLLCELRNACIRLTAVHVEHGIRGAESLADAAFVRQLCADWNVPLHTFSVDALHQAKTQHQSLEEAARELRYRCFYEACRKCGANLWQWHTMVMTVPRRYCFI